MMHQERLSVSTQGRGLYEISADLQRVVRKAEITTGLCHVFIHHTSASLIISENADPDVGDDLARFLARLVPDGDPLFQHTVEGPDDMAAHVRSVLTHTSLSLPVSDGVCALGTWQGVFLWEHRRRPHQRHITVTVQG